MIRITLIEGDGIGPDITKAVRKILNASGANLEYDEVVVGEKKYLSGATSGIDDKAWELIRRNDVMLKAPITTPTGAGYKSLNVTIRKELGLYVNLRPSVSYYPIIKKSPQKMDLVIVRENEEDLYAGIEHRQTPGSYSSLKLLTRAGALKICHYAFEYAKVNGRKKITCMVKDNIMKMADGMFYKAFLEVGKCYPEFSEEAKEHYIIDIGTARIASRPEAFDVIVTENLYGDIISDVASEISGSVGIAGSANLGEKYAMFEAIHGSAPGMSPNTANPTAFLNAAVMMLEHIGMYDHASKINNALLCTIEEGYHTKDLYVEGKSKVKLGTSEFADEIIKHFGKEPKTLSHLIKKNKSHEKVQTFDPKKYSAFLNESSREGDKKLIGVDFFIDGSFEYSEILAEKIQKLKFSELKLSSILSRGLSVWSEKKVNKNKIEFCDHWMCRFISYEISQKEKEEEINSNLNHRHISDLLAELTKSGLDVIKMEKLYYYKTSIGYERGYSMGQGE